MANEKKEGVPAQPETEGVSESDQVGQGNPEAKSEPKQEDIIKSLQGQISKLQKDLNERDEVLKRQSEFTDRIAKAVTPESEPTEEVTADKVLEEVAKLRKDIQEKEAEIEKNALIDSLEGVPEAQKIYLKKKLRPSDNLAEDIKVELEELNRVVQSSIPRATDSRPSKLASGNVDLTDARSVLDHPELFKK